MHLIMSLKHVEIYTDGACSGNPGPGGWGALLIYNGEEKEISEGEFETTNNRMELMAPIMALRQLNQKCRVTIHTDSTYVKDGITKWIHGWKAKGWKTANKKPVKKPGPMAGTGRGSKTPRCQLGMGQGPLWSPGKRAR